MHPRFREIVTHARREGLRVIDRCNLTILGEPGYADLAAFLAEQGVEVTASLPCYSRENVDRQRGDGVFEASIAGLKTLNRLGYGVDGSGLILNLVYNPQGPSLPPPQARLEADYKARLAEGFGIPFSHLLTITNQPIARFGSTLVSKGQFNGYMQLLRDSDRPENLDAVMCRSLISVDWQGYLYDCDFNQMLDLPMAMPGLIGRICATCSGPRAWTTATLSSPAPTARGRTSSRVTSRHFDHSNARRAFMSRTNRPYGLTCSHISGVSAA
ncbi:DUF3641 domain-containing protein [Azotobacter chroococcum]|uniref:DUF3641 domain-containing protein n=1 Tax=Azotobacter chroococcum TaxID=353 RepID=UPI00201DA456|nr:DUF3641 domain-containing protein [Azotobacter chroococcum]